MPGIRIQASHNCMLLLQLYLLVLLPLDGLPLGEVADVVGLPVPLPCDVLGQPLDGFPLVAVADVGGLPVQVLGDVLGKPQPGLLPGGLLPLLPGAGQSCMG